MRMGLIGYGAWGRLHAQAIAAAEGAELTAICCQKPESAEEAAAAHSEATIYRDWRELVIADLDAVDIVVPNDLHAEIGVAALEAGKDALIEKPMATTVEDCDRLIAAARDNGRVLSVGHELRLSTQWGEVKAILDRGEIGRPRYASFSLFRFPFRTGVDGWRYAPGQVGSWLLEEPVHFFDLMTWYFEAWGEPEAVRAIANARPEHQGLYQNLSVWLRFPDDLYATVTQSLGGFENHFVLEIAGSGGSLRTWWSGVMDRTYEPSFELKVKRKGAEAPETVALGQSGEVFELEEQLRLTVDAFKNRKP
ncbi:MAG: Gfo/Idh/MocA family oxidoreductase, partial [Alphaproteobacteria bacterium]|nr:Gfo/Idh/MocA family oxidoreductase [Alphaproteobacteria bacterium]